METVQPPTKRDSPLASGAKTRLSREIVEFIVDPEENEALLHLRLHRLPAKDFPRLRALGPVLADYDGAAELDQGISILLSGLAAPLAHTETSTDD